MVPWSVRFVGFAAFASCSAAAAMGGCSSSGDSSSGDGGTVGTSSFGGSTSSSSGTSSSSSSSSSGTTTSSSSSTTGGPQTVEQCIAACEAKYPNGKKKGDLIDACWAKNCPSCQDLGTGTLKGPTGKDCTNTVATPSAQCSTCTAQKCCTEWDGCFSDPECKSLNTCSIACYK